MEINNDQNNDNYDVIAPVTHDIEYQDEFEGTQDLHPEFSGNQDPYLVI